MNFKQTPSSPDILPQLRSAFSRLQLQLRKVKEALERGEGECQRGRRRKTLVSRLRTLIRIRSSIPTAKGFPGGSAKLVTEKGEKSPGQRFVIYEFESA
jgi:hypothetical protein